jgi:2'-5' RNA ligase
MGWRLFVAVDPSQAAVAHLEVAVAPLRSAGIDLRWAKPALWHLTCAFLGEVPEERVAELQDRLARVASTHDAFDLRFKGCGAFRTPTRAAVFFAGVDGPIPQLKALAASCSAVGRRIGLDIEDRAYRPHLTLARAKGGTGVDVRPLVEAMRDYEGPRWTASALHLVRSYLGSDPRHEALASWPLRPPIAPAPTP